MTPTHDELVSGLDALLSDTPVVLDAYSANVLVSHLEWVLQTNESVNLTALTSPIEALRLHIVDSVCAAPEVLGAPAGTLIDLGTGGGFPGLPLALVCGRPAVLLDSVKKKVHALELFLREHDLDAIGMGLRAEEYAVQSPGQAAVVVARAVAPMASLVELAAPILMDGGRLVALKGKRDPDELQDALRTASRCGMTYHSTREYSLPGGTEDRSVVVFERTGTPDIELPRRVGMAQKRPVR